MLVIPLAFASGVGGYYLQRAISTENPESGFVEVGDHLPDFVLPDLHGRLHNSRRWHGKILLINFWASWCPPCVRELPAFQRIRDRYKSDNVEVLGIAYDTLDNTRNFLRSRAINYPQLHGQINVHKLMQQLGNTRGTLPYTVLVNPGGRIAAIAANGELSYPEIEALLHPLLK